MPYRIRKRNCTRSDGKKGKYLLQYKPKKKTKKQKDSEGYVTAGCHTYKEKAKATATFFNAFNKGYSLIAKGAQKAVEEAKKLPDPLNKLAFLTDEQQLALAEQSKQYTLQRNADKDRLKKLQEQLKTLKQQKEALKGGTGKVNFIEAIQAGSAASIKLGIEARARATGAVDGSKELLQEIDLGIKRVGDEIEELKNNLKVENA